MIARIDASTPARAHKAGRLTPQAAHLPRRREESAQPGVGILGNA